MSQLRGLRRVGLQCRNDIDPVESVQVVEVDDVILDVLGGCDNIAHNPRILRNLNSQCIFDRTHRSQGVNSRANTADALGP